MNKTLKYIQALVLGSLLPLNVWSAPVKDRILDDVYISERDGCPEIKIGLTLPIRYIRHFPYSHGRELRVEIRPLRVSEIDQDALQKRESVSPPLREIVSLQEVVYEGDIIGGPFVTLFFHRDMQYKVEQGRDYRSLKILINPPDRIGEESCFKPIAPAAPAAPAALDDDALKQLMGEAEQGMVAESYPRAIQLYTKVLEQPDHALSQQALEFLGLARERNGQLAHAKAIYDQYLERYPEGEDADRVRQRLVGLITAEEKPKAPLRIAEAEKRKPAWEIYGGVSQFYSRNESTTIQGETEESTVNLSSLSNNLYLSGRRRGEKYNLSSSFSGGYLHDFLNETNELDEIQISNLNFETVNRENSDSLRFGRQSHSSGGVLGRFDGIMVGHQLSDQFRLNLVTGYPVFSSTISEIDTDRYFYGLNTDLNTFDDAWNFNVFFIEQRNNSILDRRAVGGEARFFEANRSFFTLVDYDISYDDLNTFLFLGHWTIESGRTYNLTLDYRNSPILTTTNAIQGQQVEALEDLLAKGISEELARQLAQDRTATSKSLTFGVVQPISEKLQMTGDITISEFTGTSASPSAPVPVDATEGTGTTFSYFVQAIGYDLIRQGDIGILGLRFTDARTSDDIALTINTRYPFTDNFRINPRLQTSYRQNDDDTSQWLIRPSVRLDYRGTRRFRTEFELGGEWSSRELTDQTSDTKGFFFTLGYRYDF